jgi:DNA polymerase-1
VVLIDGMPLIHRFFHATRQDQAAIPQDSADPVPPRLALAAFLRGLLAIRRQFQPQHRSMCLILDSPQPAFRRALDARYKTNRPPLERALTEQLGLMADVARVCGIPVCNLPSYEADDLLASYARTASSAGYRTTVISPDKDILQTLMWSGVSVYDWFKKKHATLETCMERFGVPPHQIADAQALAGDSADGFPGMPGIGPKTAARLLHEFGTIEAIYQNIDRVQPAATRQILRSHEQLVPNLRKIATLVTDIDPLPLALHELALLSIDREAMLSFLQQHQMQQLLDWYRQLDASLFSQHAATTSLP